MSKDKGDPKDPTVVFATGGLKARREADGLSLRKVAKAIGIKKRELRAYENHEVEPTLQVLQAWSRYFGGRFDVNVVLPPEVAGYEPVGWMKGSETGLGPAESAETTLYRKKSPC